MQRMRRGRWHVDEEPTASHHRLIADFDVRFPFQNEESRGHTRGVFAELLALVEAEENVLGLGSRGDLFADDAGFSELNHLVEV